MPFLKRRLIVCGLVLGLAFAAQAVQLDRIRLNHEPEKIRIVFDFDGPFTYLTENLDNQVVLHLEQALAGPDIQNYIDANDLIVRYLEVERESGGLKVSIPLTEAIKYTVFPLSDPNRLVVDFNRDFLNITSSGQLADGVELIKVKGGSSSGQLNASVLRLDLTKTGLEPVLAKQYKPNLVESFISFFAFWSKKDRADRHFFLDSVKNMVADNYALAGVNGTFFAGNGKPLGALMINGELISFSIYDRTAFFLDDQNRAYIDNLFITGDLIAKNGTSYQITGINENRGANDIIMYTPAWGESTQTDPPGVEIMIAGSKVTGVAANNAKIPENGYVISASGPAEESLLNDFKNGDSAKVALKIIPYTAAPAKITHLVSGGPRLVKNGQPYVSKHEERFRADVAGRRAARTAVGINKNGDLLLVTVEPPAKKGSAGATLEELADLMVSLGAVEAMNLDGGSSTTMIASGRTLVGGQRPVSNALIVYPKN